MHQAAQIGPALRDLSLHHREAAEQCVLSMGGVLITLVGAVLTSITKHPCRCASSVRLFCC